MSAPVTDREAVEHLLANLDESGPEEPRAFDLRYYRNRKWEDPESKALYRTLRQRRRIRTRFNRWQCEQGKECPSCGHTFRPRDVRQKRCPDCIEAGKRYGAGGVR